jgi:hypothetical protein
VNGFLLANDAELVGEFVTTGQYSAVLADKWHSFSETLLSPLLSAPATGHIFARYLDR